MLLKQIRDIHAESRGTYGSPRVHAELTLGLGLPVNLKRVARLMREAGIQGLYRRRRRGCTVRDPDARPSADLVNRAVHRRRPEPAVDHRHHRTPHRGGEGVLRGGDGRLFSADRRLVDRRAHAHRTGHRRARAWRSSVGNPKSDPPGRPGRSCTPTTAPNTRHGRSGNASERPGLLASMGTVGDCYDNAMMESFWGTMQLELLDSRTWETRDELANAIFEWIECWYNPKRRHSGIGMHSPDHLRNPPHRARPDH